MKKKFIVYVSCAFLLSCTHFFHSVNRRQPASVSGSEAPYGKSISSIPSTPDPSFFDLRYLLDEKKPNTIAEFLTHFRNSYPGYFKFFTLAYDSLSLHESSFENPRAIVFGRSGNLILTFNGHPNQRGYSNLETMEFTISEGYKFREITFLNESNGYTDLTEDEIEFRSNRYVISKPNIAKCTQCHGQTNTKPIWQTYFVWPGIYGSDDDYLYRTAFSPDLSVISRSFGRAVAVSGPDRELEGYKRYIENKDRPRIVQTEERNQSYLSRYSVLPVIASSPLREVLKSEDGLVDLERRPEDPFRPNLFLSRLFDDQLHRRFIQKLLNSPKQKETLAMIIHLMACNPEMRIQRPFLSRYISQFDYKYVNRGREVWTQNFDSLTEDIFRLDQHFGDRLVKPFNPRDERPSTFPESLSKSDRLVEILRAERYLTPAPSLQDQDVDSDVVMTLILQNIDTDLKEEFATDLRRSPMFNTGLLYYQWPRYSKALEEVWGLKTSISPNASCDDIRSILLSQN